MMILGRKRRLDEAEPASETACFKDGAFRVLLYSNFAAQLPENLDCWFH